MQHKPKPVDTLIILCPICGSDSGDTLGVTGLFDREKDSTVVLQCAECSTVYLSPMPRAESTSGSIAGNLPSNMLRTLEGLQRKIAADGKCLCADVDDNQILGRDPRKGLYKIVLLTLTTESAADPIALLQRAAALLDRGGQLYAVVSNTDSFCFKFYGGRHWFGYRFPDARQFLGQKALDVLARAAGLRIKHAKSVSAANGWLISTNNWLTDWGAHPVVVKIVTGRWLLPWLVAAMIEFFASINGNGCVLVVEMEKK